MEHIEAKRRQKLEEILGEDEIFQAYERSASELEARFSRIADSLSPEDRQVLVGYEECLKLMQLRLGTLVCEKMEFTR